MNHVVSRLSGFLQFLRERSRAIHPGQPGQNKLILWIIACNRAGKTTVLNVLKNNPGTLIYNEGSEFAYHDYRIKPRTEIAQLIADTDEDLIVFELANDLQYADAFLNLYPNSRALWIFRNYRGVVRDAVAKWGTAQKDMIVGIGQGIRKHPGQQAIAEQMGPDTLSLVRAYSSMEISAEDGAALLWYTRNQLYFQLGLDKDPRVLLVNYEQLAATPREQGKRIFDFIACPFRPAYVRDIDASHIVKTPVLGLNPEIGALCDQLLQRLTETYTAQLATEAVVTAE
jgi:hypothetical protein